MLCAPFVPGNVPGDEGFIYMDTLKQIGEYLNSQPELKRDDMQELHRIIVAQMPGCKLWFLDGKDATGRTVSNPSVGYGHQVISYANGRTREFYQVGMSANTTGISVYTLGIEDKQYLKQKFGKELGKATVTGYCIKFKALKVIKIDVLEAAIRFGIEQTNI